MPLTAPQQTKVQELESLIKGFKEQVMNSPSFTSGGSGGFFFEQFKAIEAKIEEVKKA